MDIRSKITIFGLSDVGSVRKNNEDSIGYWEDLGLMILADGMGGYQGGEMASGIAIDVMHKQLKDKLPKLKIGITDNKTGYTHESLLLEKSICAANKTILSTAERQPQFKNMGTTIVGVLFYDDRLTVAHVGDSRLYRIRQNELEQLTVDHSLVEDLVARGFYTREEADNSLNKNVLLRALGPDKDVQVDILEDFVLVGDIYLNCSDGLTNMVTDEQILTTILKHQDNLNKAVSTLIKMANENGGKDNISVILARVDKEFPTKLSWFKTFTSWFLK